MYDILIKNGLIVDGSGNPAFYGDLAVKDGKIAKIAPSIEAAAAEIIDAAGHEVALITPPMREDAAQAAVAALEAAGMTLISSIRVL